jgi:hypothetical protein
MDAIVQAADIQDRNGGVLMMATLFGLDPFLLRFHADAQAPDRGTHHRLLEALPTSEQRLEVPQPQCTCSSPSGPQIG